MVSYSAENDAVPSVAHCYEDLGKSPPRSQRFERAHVAPLREHEHLSSLPEVGGVSTFSRCIVSKTDEVGRGRAVSRVHLLTT